MLPELSAILFRRCQLRQGFGEHNTKTELIRVEVEFEPRPDLGGLDMRRQCC